MIIPASLINAANAEAPRWELGQSRARSGTPGTPGILGKSHNTRPPSKNRTGDGVGGKSVKAPERDLFPRALLGHLTLPRPPLCSGSGTMTAVGSERRGD